MRPEDYAQRMAALGIDRGGFAEGREIPEIPVKTVVSWRVPEPGKAITRRTQTERDRLRNMERKRDRKGTMHLAIITGHESSELACRAGGLGVRATTELGEVTCKQCLRSAAMREMMEARL